MKSRWSGLLIIIFIAGCLVLVKTALKKDRIGYQRDTVLRSINYAIANFEEFEGRYPTSLVDLNFSDSFTLDDYYQRIESMGYLRPEYIATDKYWLFVAIELSASYEQVNSIPFADTTDSLYDPSNGTYSRGNLLAFGGDLSFSEAVKIVEKYASGNHVAPTEDSTKE